VPVELPLVPVPTPDDPVPVMPVLEPVVDPVVPRSVPVPIPVVPVLMLLDPGLPVVPVAPVPPVPAPDDMPAEPDAPLAPPAPAPEPPLPPLCANASELVSASAAANPIVASLIWMPFLLWRRKQARLVAAVPKIILQFMRNGLVRLN
jgi:hypothetical protein